MIHLLLKGLGLLREAQVRSIDITFMSDGADLTNKEGGKHISAGIKVTDLGAMDPDRPGEYLFLEHDKDGTVIYKNTHSLKHMQLCETVAATVKPDATPSATRDDFNCNTDGGRISILCSSLFIPSVARNDVDCDTDNGGDANTVFFPVYI